MTLLLAAAVSAAAYLIYRNYQLEKRWRCMRYCWQSMSDFAGERLKDGGEVDPWWRDVVKEQVALMGRFGAAPLTTDGVRVYELALLERDLPILTEHKQVW